MDEIEKMIAEVERLDREATPGPWLHYKRANTKQNEWPAWAISDVGDEEEQRIAAEGELADIALTVHYRTAAPILAAEVRRLRAELARRDALDAAWNAGAAEARGRVLHNLAADPRDHMPPEFRADEEIAAAWLAGWAADAAIVRLAEIERECDDARGVEVHGGDFEDEAMVERAAEQEATSTDSGDEYDYTRCICLDSVSRWCPTCGEEYAERRAADKALKSDAPDGIEVVQVADLQSARDGRAQVLREGASLTIRCVIHDQPLQATHCGGGGGEGMMDLAIPVYRCGVCGYAAHSIDWIQDHIKRWWLPNGAESTRMDIDAERHDGEPWSTQYLRVGDSVMWSVGRGGYNGLRGRVVAIQPDLTWFTVRWADGRSLPYETNDTLWALFPRRQEGVRS